MSIKLPLFFSLFFFYFWDTAAQIIVHDVQKISSLEGDLPNLLDDSDYFGTALSPIGDLDNNGVSDLIVGVMNDDDGGPDRGAVYILYLNEDHTVKSHLKISSISGSFTGSLQNYVRLGIAADAIGDLNNDGTVDIAVGANYDSETGHETGAIWILFMNADGTVKAQQKINAAHGNFNRNLVSLASFGSSISALGDLDGDGNTDIAVGAYRDNSPTSSKTGALYVLFLNSNGTVKSSKKIAENEGGFTDDLIYEGYFGGQVAPVGDFNNDGIIDIAVSAFRDSDGGYEKGAVWILFLNRSGNVVNSQKISQTRGNFAGTLESGDFFGASLVSLGDLNDDGVPDLAVGADRDNDGGTSKGAVWILYLNRNGTVKSHQKISDTEGCFSGYLDNNDFFAGSIAVIDNLFNDDLIILAVAAVLDDDGGTDRGSVYLITLNKGKTPFAGDDTEICNNSVQLNAHDYHERFLPEWTVLHGSGQIEEINNPKSKVVNLSEGKNTFRWSVKNGTCEFSDTVEIHFTNSNLETPNAGNDSYLCKNSAFLNAQLLNSDHTGTWKVISGGAEITDSTNTKSEVLNLSSGRNSFVWTISNGTCSVSDTVSIFNLELNTDAYAGEDIKTCSDSTVLKANDLTNGISGEWQVLSGYINFLDINNPKSKINNISTGSNKLIWKITNQHCYDADTINVYNDKIEEIPFAGQDKTLCETHTLLEANAIPLTVTGEWQVIAGTGEIANINNNITEVKNLSSGLNQVLWKYTRNGCYISDTINLIYDELEGYSFNSEDVFTCFNTIEFKDIATTGFSGEWSIIHGDAEIVDSTVPNPQIINLSQGQNQFIYSINNGCRKDTLTVYYGPVDVTLFPNVITPNNDGKNEVLVFDGIMGYENSKLTVVNRWGKIIFETNNYKNNWNCLNCPPGIYYYRLQAGECVDYKGWLHILK